MKWAGWAVGTVLFLLMLYACALPGELAVGKVSDSGLAGTYTVNGIDAQGVEYSGTVVIIATDDTMIYDLEWIITGSILRGSGTHAGDQFVVSWETSSAGAAGTGRTDYVVHADGRLVGIRQTEGFDGTGNEELFPEA